MNPILKIEHLTMRFGGIVALKDLSFEVREGEIHSLIGPNGAGKTTVFNAITGIFPPSSGKITFFGREISGPFTWKQGLSWGLIGLLCSVGLALVCADVNALWKASVKRLNEAELTIARERGQPPKPISIAEMTAATANFLRGGFAIDPVTATVWRVQVQATGATIASFVNRDEALRRLRVITEQDPQALQLVERGNGFAVVGDETLAEFVSKEDAEQFVSGLRSNGKSFLASRGSQGTVWQIVSADGNVATEGFLTLLEANSRLADYASISVESDFRLSPSSSSTIQCGELSIHGQNEAWARRTLEALKISANESSRRRIVMAIGTIFGLSIGAAGAAVVWSRSRRAPEIVARSGITRTFQNIRLFSSMTVFENVLVANDTSGKGKSNAPEQTRLVDSLLELVGLTAKRNALSRSLPYGEQRRLEIARALAGQPKLLLLDEPAAGMNPSESQWLMELIHKIRDRGTTVLLIEHHMNLVMRISDRITVLHYGEKIAEGTPAEVQANPRVVEAYLGKEESH